MYPQNAFNLIVEITTGKRNDLQRILDAIQNDVEDNPYFNFTKITTIHFARFVILEEEKDSNGHVIFPAYLAFESNYDGLLDAHLHDIVTNTKANNGFDAVFGYCKNYPSDLSLTDAQRIDFLKTHSHYHPYFYRGTWGRSLAQIKAEEQTRDQIQSFLNQHDLRSLSEREIFQKIKSNIKGSSYKKINPPSISALWIRITPLLIWIAYAIFYLLYSGIAYLAHWRVHVFLPQVVHFIVLGSTVVFFMAVVLFFIILRKKERSDEPLNKLYDPNPDTVSLRTAEDRIVQNQLTHLVKIKEGWFRLFTLKMVLFLIETLAIYKFNQGKLGGIPSIHFARWIIIDKGKRLLFYSNFDGSWENYLGDFIDRAAVGLTAVWSNTNLFPKTKNLIFEGATDEQQFKSWTRMHQIPTQVWYSAYKYLTVENIDNNTALQEALNREGELTNEELKNWMLKL